MSSNASSERFHRRYNHEDGDVILLSSDRIKFRVHSILLKTNSSVFRDMVELASPYNEAILVTENSKTLDSLLDFIYPSDAPSLPKPTTLKSVELLVGVADKYSMPRVIASLRSIVLGEEKYRASPIDLYVLACKWNWQDVAEVASTETLKFNLSEDACVDKLQQLDGPDLCRLLKLHGHRKRQIVECLTPVNYEETLFGSGPRPHYANCFCMEQMQEVGVTDGIEESDWLTANTAVTAHQILEDFISGSLERRPLGDQLVPNAFSHPMFDFVRNIVCPWCKNKYLNLDSIAIAISEKVDKGAVRSIRDI